jgi:hypothetical protein
MTFFLGFVLLCVVCDVVGNSSVWWRFTLSLLLALAIAGLMMLSYWDWHPTW